MSKGKYIRKLKPLKERLESLVMPEPNSGCWLWLGTCGGDGYGRINAACRNYLAHRVSYKTYVGEIPSGLHILHRCDNPLCVNPEHLFAGTDADNAADKVSKGRQLKGTSIFGAKLNEEQVRKILSSSVSQRSLARKYKVNQSQISRIKRGEAWLCAQH